MKKGSWVKGLAAAVLMVLFLGLMTGNEASAMSGQTGSKKGIQTGSYYELVYYDGSNAFFNLDVSTLVSDSGSDDDALYKFDGKQYYLNWYRLYSLQNSCSILKNSYNAQSITIGLLPYRPVPGITVNKTLANANIYGFYPATSANVTAIKALVNKIAEYLGEYVDYWQIGNEIDNYVIWNATGVTNIDTYAKHYSDSMRIVNDIMKKKNSNVCIVIPFDQGWNHTDSQHFSTKTLLTKIANNIKNGSGGDFNWGLSLHPYPTPLTSANWWNDSSAGCPKADSADMVTFYNLEVITNYMNTSAMKYNNAVRPIILTEWGINAYEGNTENQTQQAASFARAYYKAAGNPYIKSVVYNAMTDAWGGNATYHFGIDGREIENVFRHIDMPDGYQYTKKYLSYFGVSNWESLLTPSELGAGSSFTGTLTVGDHAVYYTKGAVDTSKNGLYTSKSDGRVFYLTKGRSDVTYSTVVKDSSGKMYYISHGMKDPDFTGMEKCIEDGKFYFLENGGASTYTGVVLRPSTGVWHYVKNGVYVGSFTGFAPKYDGGTVYVKSGKFDDSVNGIITVSGTRYIVQDGYLQEYFTGLKRDDKWYFFENGVQNKTYTGVVERPDTGDWYYVKNGVYDSTFTGFAEKYNYSYYPVYVKNGKWQKDYSGYAKDPATGKWYYVGSGYQYYEVNPISSLSSDWITLIEGMTETVTEDGVTWEKYPETGLIYVSTIMGDYSGTLDEVNAKLLKNIGEAYTVTVESDQEPGNPWGTGYHYLTLRAGNRSTSHRVVIISVSDAASRLYPGSESWTIPAGKYEYMTVYDYYTGNQVAGFTMTSSNEEVASVDKNGKITAKGAGNCVITASYPPAGLEFNCEVRVLFKDVADDSKYFYEPVYWAFERGITTGTSASMFSPNKNCTRAQFVTFLWRFCGSPEPETDAGFTDVKEGAFYEKAVNWAAENKITTGLNDGTGNFGINNDCTRAQCITFLWRAAGQPVDGIEDAENFKDVKEGAFYETAVKWGSANGITTGLNDGTGRFGVSTACTRGMTVTFLKRYSDYLDSRPEEPEEP